MNILLATFWQYPLVSGVSSYMTQLKRGLQIAGHNVDILAHGSGPQKMISHRLSSYLSPSPGSWVQNYEVDRYSYELAAVYGDLAQYDLIHTQDVVSTYAISRVKPKHIPLVATIHGSFTREVNLSPESNPLIWHYCATFEYRGTVSSAVTIVPTHWLKHVFIRNFRVPAKQMHVIPYGMDVTAFIERMHESASLAIPADKSVIVCPARLTSVKGHYTLIQALAQLRKKRTDWVCLLLGDGPLRKQLEQNCHLYHLQEHVIFTGNRYDVPAILHKADVCVLPSLFDNHPFAIMESQVAGKAVVTTDAGGIPEMVSHGHTGLISPAGHPQELADNLERVLSDREFRMRLATRAKHWARQEWDMNTMLKRIRTVYKKVMQSGGVRMCAADMEQRPNVFPFNLQTTGPQIEREVWKKICASLPHDYRIPDPVFEPIIKRNTLR